RTHVPEPPPEDWVHVLLQVHAGTGSFAGSSTGAGAGMGSSSGEISISCSVSGAPMSISASSQTCRTPVIPSSRHNLHSGSDGKGVWETSGNWQEMPKTLTEAES